MKGKGFGRVFVLGIVRAVCVCVVFAAAGLTTAAATPPVHDWTAVSPPGSGDPAVRFGGDVVPYNQHAMAVDAAGNTFVTGSANNGSNLDYLTQKFDPNGDLLWSATYNGPGNGEDVAVALAVDGVGNVFVTGYSVGNGTGQDYATLKYNGDTGAPMWSGGAIVNGAARYNGPPGNLNDYAYALAVDGAGNVFVTGRSAGSSTGDDYATLKYNGNTGAPMWSGGAIVDGAARYNGPSNNADIARALVVDGAGNVFVTGSSIGSGTGLDYATLKYNGGTGAPMWSGGAIVSGAARYNGPVGSSDVATALAVNGAGNVFVTGYSLGSGTSNDYATLKYNGATGAPMWSGGAIVNGAARYNGPGNGIDNAFALALDGDGNVFVTGQSVGSGTGEDYATLKYNGNTGAPMWSDGAIVDGAARYTGPGNTWDMGYALAVDGAGNVFVTGTSPGNGTGQDYATIKYAGSNGSLMWPEGGGVTNGAVRYNGPGNDSDIAYAIAIAPDGDLRVAGTRRGALNNDFGLIRYAAASGAEVWVASEGQVAVFLSQLGSNATPYNKHAMAVDAAGNTFVTGRVHNGSSYDYLT